MHQASYSTKDTINILSSQNISQHICKAFKDPKHTHTHQTSLTNFIFQNKLRQFSEHILTHVFLVMNKSHYTCTCIKSSKEFTCCVWKTLQDCISVYMLWWFEIWETQFNLHTIIIAWWDYHLRGTSYNSHIS